MEFTNSGPGVNFLEDKFPKAAFKSEQRLEGSTNILAEAQKIIYGDREKTYGHPAKNLATIAKLWDTYLGRPYGTMTVSDVCNMMVLLKVARLQNDPEHHDSLVDICGYTALNQRVQDHARIKDHTSEAVPQQSRNS